MSLLMRTLKALKRKGSSSYDVVPNCDRPLEAYVPNPRDAELLLWHENHKTYGKIQHPRNGRQWKQFDLAHPKDFSNDPRNIRLGLRMNGMSPFREMRNPHSTW
jgi:hypothetical protein